MPESDYREELQLLFDAAESFVEPALGHHRPWAKAMDRARALLAQPEPVAPSDEELDELYFDIDARHVASWRHYARAVLAKWGDNAHSWSASLCSYRRGS